MVKLLRISLIAAFLLILSAFQFAIAADVYTEKLDMQDFPNQFISNGMLDVDFVVGEFADPEDVLSLVDISTSLNSALKESQAKLANSSSGFTIDVTGNPHDELTELYMEVLNKKKAYAGHTSLDTYYNKSGLKDKNLILVGGPCVNWISAYLLDYPKDCTAGFQQNKGYLQLFRNGKGIILMVAGYSASDTRQAARILANYKDFSSNFVGEKVRVSSAWIDEIKVK